MTRICYDTCVKDVPIALISNSGNAKDGKVVLLPPKMQSSRTTRNSEGFSTSKVHKVQMS